MSFATQILTTTDFSEAADAGVSAAAQIAKDVGASVSLIHVFDPAPLSPRITRGADISVQLADEQHVETTIREALDEVVGRLLDGIDNVEIQVIQSANPADAICTFAKDGGHDLIVLSTHGRTGLSHLLIGSVAERVVRHAHCATLVQPSANR